MDLNEEFFSVESPCYGTLGQKICRALPPKGNIRERKKEMEIMLPVVAAGRLQLEIEATGPNGAERCKGQSQFWVCCQVWN